jgi:murein DD-endopeptidase MepM/ murein hydrolase activator NlpD
MKYYLNWPRGFVICLLKWYSGNRFMIQKIRDFFLSQKFVKNIPAWSEFLLFEAKAFISFIKIYGKDKAFIFSDTFENNKNTVVKNVLIKRGKRNRMFLHVSALAVLTAGVVLSPFISDSSLFGGNTNISTFAQGAQEGEQSLISEDVFQTQASEKPRDKIITYVVQKGDTISTIAKKFGISIDTIKWENNLKSDTITVGDSLLIMPVTGMSHKVARGDTVYTIAKKYSANAQAIVDYPFNDFANPQTFSLVEGQILIVPDGVKPEEAPRYIRQTFIASGPVVITGGGFTWPVRGTLNQGYAWYHKGIDIGASVGVPVVAAQSGVAAEVYTGGWNSGYGTHVIVSGDNGYSTLYAHMSAVNVSPGQRVVAGSTVLGWVGMTGRTTGPHLHFEVRGGGAGFLSPLSVLQ